MFKLNFLQDISKKIAGGIRSHRSKSLFLPAGSNNDDGWVDKLANIDKYLTWFLKISADT